MAHICNYRQTNTFVNNEGNFYTAWAGGGVLLLGCLLEAQQGVGNSPGDGIPWGSFTKTIPCSGINECWTPQHWAITNPSSHSTNTAPFWVKLHPTQISRSSVLLTSSYTVFCYKHQSCSLFPISQDNLQTGRRLWNSTWRAVSNRGTQLPVTPQPCLTLSMTRAAHSSQLNSSWDRVFHTRCGSWVELKHIITSKNRIREKIHLLISVNSLLHFSSATKTQKYSVYSVKPKSLWKQNHRVL